MPSDISRFSIILLCFLLSFWRGLPFAAFLTLCADFFLIFTDAYTIGISFFLFVQLAYLQNLRNRPFPPQAFILFPLFLCLPILFLGFCYAILFLCHFLLAVKKAQPCLSAKLYLLGLILFLCCDITVAWGYFHTPNPRLIWFFYAPSQLLLALTAAPTR